MINKIKNMRVEKKLRTCFSAIAVIASFSGVLGLFILLYCNINYSHALVNNGFSQGEIGMFSTYLSKEPSLLREVILVEDSASMSQLDTEIAEMKAKTDAAYATMLEHCNTETELEYISQIDELMPKYRSLFAEIEALALENRNDEALNTLLTEAKPVFKQLTAAIEGLINYNVTAGDSISDRLTVQAYVMIALMLVIIILAFILSGKISISVARLFAEPIIKIQEATAELAEGHLDVKVEKMYPDEIGEMTDSFNEAIHMISQYTKELSRVLSEAASGNFNISSQIAFKGDFRALDDAINKITSSLSSTLGNIYEASEQVSLGASQMASSAQALAEGATDQAASVEQLTATIQDITEAVINSSEKATQSYRNAEAFKRDAEESNEDILLLNQAMERINDTSKEIANIIAAIEDIASQTNLLSLNASIEAARAGEAGRGFAVVADQIGKLASDSAASAVDTKKLIEHSLQEIDRGNEITAKATAAIDAVIKGINALAASTNEISELSETQADAMKQLEAGVEQISEVIQNNSAAAQQTSATSEELSAQSDGLEQLVGQFTLKK